ncbi:MAG: hypothetical protein QM766_27980 [Burkholderiaceae bacterium]
MSRYKALASADDFSGGYYVWWFEHNEDELVPVTQIDAGTAQYVLEDPPLRVSIDIAGIPGPVTLSICGPFNVLGGSNGQFALGDPVLIADCDPIRKPLRLTFDPPVRAVGTRIAALGGKAGESFDATLYAGEADGQSQGRGVRAICEAGSAVAPFVGLRCLDGARISEAWFDTISPDGQGSFKQVAINQLYLIP